MHCSTVPVHTKPAVWVGLFFPLQNTHFPLCCAYLVPMCAYHLEFQKVFGTKHFLKVHPCQTHFVRGLCLVPDKLSNLHHFK